MAKDRRSMIRAAEKLVARGKLEAAIKQYRKVLRATPDDTGTLNRVGDIYARLDRLEEAVEIFTKAADHFVSEGFLVKAIAILKKIIRLDPTRIGVYETLADLYHRQGLRNEARSQYQVVADYYLQAEKTEKVRSIYEKMIELEPANPSHRVKLAELYCESGMIPEAMDQYQRIAAFMLDHGRVDEALSVYRGAVDLSPSDLGFLTDVVLHLKDQAQLKAAEQLLAEAIRKNPEAARVRKVTGLSSAGPATPVVTPDAAPVSIDGAAPEEERSREEPAPVEEAAEEPVLEPVIESVAEATLEPEDSQLADEALAEARSLEEKPAGEIEIGELPTDVASGEEAAALVIGEGEDEPESSADDEVSARDGDGVLVLDLDTAAEDLPFAVEERVSSEVEEVLEPVEELEIDLDELEVDLSELGVEAAVEPVEEPVGEPLEEPVEELVAELIEELVGEPLAEARKDEVAPALELPSDSAVEMAGDEAAVVGVESDHVAPEDGVVDEVLAVDSALEVEEEEAKAEPEPEEAVAGVPDLSEVGAPGGAVSVEEVDVVATAEEALASADAAAPLPSEIEDEPVVEEVLGSDEETEVTAVIDAAAVEAGSGAEELIGEARMLSSYGLASKASSLCEQAIELEPARLEAYDLLIALYHEEENWNSAAHAATRARAAAGGESAGWKDLAERLENLGYRIVDERIEPPMAAEVAAEASIETVESDGEEQGSSLAGIEDLGWLGGESSAEQSFAEAEEIFGAEDEFFDLAAELEEELEREEDEYSGEFLPQLQEQSLEEIVEGFKKGVSETLSEEDHETHYNLGIAYREMGLLDEAIGEFQLAAKAPAYLVDCCSLLGSCFLEKGFPDLAIKWFERGLEAPNVTENESLGLLYELGNLYLITGDKDVARKTFAEIYGVNSNYRDVVAKLEELRST